MNNLPFQYGTAFQMVYQIVCNNACTVLDPSGLDFAVFHCQCDLVCGPLVLNYCTACDDSTNTE